jgi:hypothetical protein
MNLRDCVYIPTFHNLSHMDLTFDRVYIGCNVVWNWFAQMLHNSPKLQNLTISKVWISFQQYPFSFQQGLIFQLCSWSQVQLGSLIIIVIVSMQTAAAAR